MEQEREDIKNFIDAFSEVIKLIHQRSYDNLDELKLYPGQAKLLALIKEHEGITQKELSEKNFVKPATITGMLNKLEANGLVKRILDEEDKRIMRVYLTDDGQRLAKKGKEFLFSLTGQMLKGFTEEEVKSYLMLLDKIKRNLQE
ncbi:MarR family transcriptional regulator [Mobilitalea sibirica]|uniref:MarR family transcriptional regulator n=1 Tax=Mobilitalea sibirica TaxID=1462919 RepID=A0A8J7KX94_9FIRM|nr:MarR family transcriptional regulator [Mobilitalea sibirica]MBH1941517.1 MarR family transcriptional regulator [Mobilitalea sibirica]